MTSTPSRARLSLPGNQEIRAEKARRHLFEFVRLAWSIVEPAMPFIDTWATRALCEHLEAVSRGEIRQLLINVPPGHAKSLIVSVLWPAWTWISRPSWRGIFASYSSDLTIRDSQRCRQVVESIWYQRHYAQTAGWELSGDQNVKSYFTNTRTGARLSLSVGSKATGFRGNATVVDDPINVTDAQSKLKRDEVIFWWDKVMSSRLNDMANDARVIIMQRVHEDDLAGHVIDQGGYEHVCLPSEYESARKSITYIQRKEHVPGCPGVGEPRPVETIDPITGDSTTIMMATPCPCKTRREELWRDQREVEGELLFPQLFPEAVLAEAKTKLGSEGYAGQHQQRPAPEDGEKFKKAWWRFYKPDGIAATGTCPRPKGCYEGPARPLPDMHRIILSLDAAFKDTDGTDYVVFQVWGCNGADRYLLDSSRARRSFTATLVEFKRLCAKWPAARKKIVEDKANGSAIIDTLKSTIAGIVGVNPEGGKEARAAAVQPQVESGNVYLPDGASWIEEFVAEFTSFPNGKHDDQVDALSQALLELADSTGMARARGLANL